MMVGIAHVFTISHVAKMLSEDEEWLREISINMAPEEGCLWVIGVDEDGCSTRLHIPTKADSEYD